jgi:glycosyltransferase involved in cell wall biosynthesis
MKVIQVVPCIGNESSGPSYSVPSLCGALHKNNVEVELHTLQPSSPREFEYKMVDYPVNRLTLYRWDRSVKMRRGLINAAKSAQIIHTHSIGSAPSSIYPALAARKSEAKLIVTPRGWLDPAARRNGKFFKRFKWYFMGVHRALAQASMFHATAMSEYDYIRQAGFKQPVTVIPNGIDLPKLDLLTNMVQNDGLKRLIFMSRLHPKKNIESLLHAWNNVQETFNDWELLIVGPDKNNSYANKMKAFSQKLANQRVNFCGEINGQAKTELLIKADLFVLPTHSENFGMVIAEALACGTPAICTVGAPWQGLNKHKAGWWIEHGVDNLTTTLFEAMSSNSDKLHEMGMRGHEWMAKDFSWSSIGRKMLKSYDWLYNKNIDKPEWIIVD